MNIKKGRYWDKPLGWVQGCSPVSPGCLHCWSASEANIRQYHSNPVIRAQYEGLTHKVNGVPTFNGTVRVREDRLDIPLKVKKPTVWAIWSDLFHEAVPDEFIDKTLAVMTKAEQHTFLVLTKRPERMADHVLRAMFDDECRYEGWYEELEKLGIPEHSPPENIYYGTTAENQAVLDSRLRHVLSIPGKHFLSIEPMLGFIDFDAVPNFDLPSTADTVSHKDAPWDEYVDVVILGGETGPRPMHPDWVRYVRDQCAAAGVPFFLKNLGEWSIGESKDFGKYQEDTSTGQYMIRKKAGRLLDGRTHDELPWLPSPDRDGRGK